MSNFRLWYKYNQPSTSNLIDVSVLEMWLEEAYNAGYEEGVPDGEAKAEAGRPE